MSGNKNLRSILSELAVDVKSLSIDDRISFRYLYEKFTSKLSYFFRLETKSREILSNPTYWEQIYCMELIDVFEQTCGFIDGCNTLKRTKNKVPDAFDSNYGRMLKVVTLGVKGGELKLINSFEYKDYVNREYKPKYNVGWLNDNYIYIPNTDLEVIKVLLIPKLSYDVDKLNGDTKSCSRLLDSRINYPDYLIALAKQETLKELAGGYKRFVEDERGDNNTNNK